MSAHRRLFLLLALFIFIPGKLVAFDSLDSDREVLLDLRSHLESQNPVNQGKYAGWSSGDVSPCNWSGITCADDSTGQRRVSEINLSASNIAGSIFVNFSALTGLTRLDLSGNTIGGVVPPDLTQCKSLKFLNVSHNILTGEVNLTGLTNLEILDLSLNRIHVDIGLVVPEDCTKMSVLNVSSNNITGRVEGVLRKCLNLKYLDLSTNRMSGDLWPGFDRIEEVLIADNRFSGIVPGSTFTQNCVLRVLDLSGNQLSGQFPGEIVNCTSIEMLNLWGNQFTGKIPDGIGSLANASALYLGKNNFSREIPNSLLNLTRLMFLDLSGNGFGGNVQPIFGKFQTVRFLLLHRNSYTGGIVESGVLSLPNIARLDLSHNNFTGKLPVEIAYSRSLKFLVLAYNGFTGSIPPDYGNLTGIQAIDLSNNRLTGQIPASFGNLRSLLWLMLAENSLSGRIPKELGNCSSLLWLNLANNRLTGAIPAELARIGKDSATTFAMNRENDLMSAGSGECLTMMRWIPADYPPFSFMYNLLTRKRCRELWEKILKGDGLFSICIPGSNVRTTQVAGYIQLCGNELSGEIPSDMSTMLNFSMIHLGYNQLTGKLPPAIGNLPLVVFNISNNKFFGEIPSRLGDMKCLLNLDLSYNNFSGVFPTSLNGLSELSKFNVSYNPYLSGSIPGTGQLVTLGESAFFGDPLLRLPPFLKNEHNDTSSGGAKSGKEKTKEISAFLVGLALVLTFLVCGFVTLVICLVVKSPRNSRGKRYLLGKDRLEYGSSSGSSSPWLSDTTKVICLDKTPFTHSDIIKATLGFSDDRIIGRGGSGTVYRGVLKSGKEVAVKKLATEGIEAEREFRAEMEVLSGNGLGWPHPNLVTLYGWCLSGSEKLLVYEYMDGGSLEDFITDRISLNWKRRIEIAIDVARALVYLHHECFPSIVHRDVKASNVLLDRNGKACVTDFGLARVVDVGGSHVSTMVAGTVGYVAPEYGQTWQATTKGDVYSYGVLAMELATGRRAVDGGEECLVEWAKRVMGDGRTGHAQVATIPVALMVSGLEEGEEKMSELLRIGLWCTAESPNSRPNMKEVLSMLFRVSCSPKDSPEPDASC